jgi:hypothetical protein
MNCAGTYEERYCAFEPGDAEFDSRNLAFIVSTPHNDQFCGEISTPRQRVIQKVGERSHHGGLLRFRWSADHETTPVLAG